MTIEKLIISDKILDAINLLHDKTTAALLASRFNSLEKKNRMGILTRQEYSTQRNRIVSSVLSEAECTLGVTIESRPVLNTDNTNKLLSIHKKYKRRNIEFAQKVLAVHQEFISYFTKKDTEPGFDIRGRKLRSLEASREAIIKESIELEGDNAESKVKKIMKLISEPIPTYVDLKTAFDLANGLGLIDHWIPQVLKHKPNDEDVRIRIAEMIEDFVEGL